MVVSAPLMLLAVALKRMGRPISVARVASVTGAPEGVWVAAAVRLVVVLILIAAQPAVSARCKRGMVLKVPAVLVALSVLPVPGSASAPHQLLVASTVPVASLRKPVVPPPPPVGAVLPVMREKLTISVPAPEARKMP